MKILFQHHVPALLAHGGLAIQITNTQRAVMTAGVETEFLRWWDDQQTGDIIHYFGRMPIFLVELARAKGIKVVIEDLLTEQAARSRGHLWLQRQGIRMARRLLPKAWLRSYGWDAYTRADLCLTNTRWEAHLLSYLFAAPSDKIKVLPNGVEDVFLHSAPLERGPWLLCVATITPRKRILELARAAVQAQTPLRIMGRPYAESDPYFRSFCELVAAQPQWLRYAGAVESRLELARAYRQARGFVLLSAMETSSLAVGEAAACACPLLLSDQPWARELYAQSARYLKPGAPAAAWADALRQFYHEAPQRPIPPRPPAWTEIGAQLADLYRGLMAGQS